jgi:hypothetical protein
LLKSTLLQLDSSFSERDYGAGTFRDFAEKLEQRGFVTLKHNGRTTLVELTEAGAREDEGAAAGTGTNGSELREVPVAPRGEYPRAVENRTAPDLSLADGVALVRAVLAEATTPPRWPMYLRQMKQFIRAARPDFDERRYGSLPDLLRACQKDGLLRLERDRQGGLRAFAGSVKASSLPHGWEGLAGPDTPEAPGAEMDDMQPASLLAPADEHDHVEEATAPVEAIQPEVPAAPAPDPDEPDDDQLAMFGVVKPDDPEPVGPRGTRRTRKTAAAKSERPRRTRAKSGDDVTARRRTTRKKT